MSFFLIVSLSACTIEDLRGLSQAYTAVDVSVRSQPAAATILVDGASYGRTPLLIKLQPGNHQLTLVRKGCANLSMAFVTLPTGVTRINVNLSDCAQEPSCSDSDNGPDLFAKGTVTVFDGAASATHDDACDRNVLNEWICQGLNAVQLTTPCYNGCEDGRCRERVSTPTQPLCADSDGGKNYMGLGVVTWTAADGIQRSSADRCVSGNILEEGFCMGSAPRKEQVVCYPCVDGRCMNPPQVDNCFDSDNGINETSAGYIQGYWQIIGAYNRVDYCVNASVVLEHYCADGKFPANVTRNCQYGCDPIGKCKPAPYLCTDTDGGDNSTVKGTVTVTNAQNLPGIGTYVDNCTGIDTLTEYYCSQNNLSISITYPCSQVAGGLCIDGACVVAQCNDTDGGVTILVQGNISYFNGTATATPKDFCHNVTHVMEYNCVTPEGGVNNQTLFCQNQCANGACNNNCPNACVGRSCGSDVCGNPGACGSCAAGSCNTTFQCMCSDGRAPCGSTCCPTGQFCNAGTCSATVYYANLSGTVRNSTGSALAGATVSLNGAVSTDGLGYYRLLNKATGSSTVTVQASGYQDNVTTLTLNAGENTKDFIMYRTVSGCSSGKLCGATCCPNAGDVCINTNACCAGTACGTAPSQTCCAAGSSCQSGQCCKNDGQTCTSAGQCCSGNCNGGVCSGGSIGSLVISSFTYTTSPQRLAIVLRNPGQSSVTFLPNQHYFNLTASPGRSIEWWSTTSSEVYAAGESKTYYCDNSQVFPLLGDQTCMGYLQLPGQTSSVTLTVDPQHYIMATSPTQTIANTCFTPPACGGGSTQSIAIENIHWEDATHAKLLFNLRNTGSATLQWNYNNVIARMFNSTATSSIVWNALSTGWTLIPGQLGNDFFATTSNFEYLGINNTQTYVTIKAYNSSGTELVSVRFPAGSGTDCFGSCSSAGLPDFVQEWSYSASTDTITDRICNNGGTAASGTAVMSQISYQDGSGNWQARGYWGMGNSAPAAGTCTAWHSLMPTDLNNNGIPTNQNVQIKIKADYDTQYTETNENNNEKISAICRGTCGAVCQSPIAQTCGAACCKNVTATTDGECNDATACQSCYYKGPVQIPANPPSSYCSNCAPSSFLQPARTSKNIDNPASILPFNAAVGTYYGACCIADQCADNTGQCIVRGTFYDTATKVFLCMNASNTNYFGVCDASGDNSNKGKIVRVGTRYFACPTDGIGGWRECGTDSKYCEVCPAGNISMRYNGGGVANGYGNTPPAGSNWATVTMLDGAQSRCVDPTQYCVNGSTATPKNTLVAGYPHWICGISGAVQGSYRYNAAFYSCSATNAPAGKKAFETISGEDIFCCTNEAGFYHFTPGPCACAANQCYYDGSQYQYPGCYGPGPIPLVSGGTYADVHGLCNDLLQIKDCQYSNPPNQMAGGQMYRCIGVSPMYWTACGGSGQPAC